MNMARAPFQVLIIPFKRSQDGVEYLVLKRSDTLVWQGVAGGGEDKEIPIEAAARELREETGLGGGRLERLDSVAQVPVMDVAGELTWGNGVLEIPEFAFAYEVLAENQINLSDEHVEYKWPGYDSACSLLEWESNKAALKEIHELIQSGDL